MNMMTSKILLMEQKNLNIKALNYNKYLILSKNLD